MAGILSNLTKSENPSSVFSQKSCLVLISKVKQVKHIFYIYFILTHTMTMQIKLQRRRLQCLKS
jgi:hypothetical protein